MIRSTFARMRRRSGLCRSAPRSCASMTSRRAARWLISSSLITPRLAYVKRVYLDHAATTPVDPEVADAMARVLRDAHGNPSSIYAEGRAARELVDRAREDVAAVLGAQPTEIVFTSGGTEADHLALRGVMKARRGLGDHLVTTAIEHHAVLDTARDLESSGHVRVTIVPVDRDGRVDPAAIAAAIEPKPTLGPAMPANNE